MGWAGLVATINTPSKLLVELGFTPFVLPSLLPFASFASLDEARCLTEECYPVNGDFEGVVASS